jgi:hypothetical protein
MILVLSLYVLHHAGDCFITKVTHILGISSFLTGFPHASVYTAGYWLARRQLLQPVKTDSLRQI